jgi:hypothetical protein
LSGAGGIDVRRALRTYVLGRDAGYDSALKEELAESRLERGSAAGSAPASTPDPAFRPAEPGPRPEPRPSFGVPVPERLAFHRSASRWRDLIPGLRSGGA